MPLYVVNSVSKKLSVRETWFIIQLFTGSVHRKEKKKPKIFLFNIIKSVCVKLFVGFKSFRVKTSFSEIYLYS